jgi:hypothetical protein
MKSWKSVGITEVWVGESLVGGRFIQGFCTHSEWISSIFISLFTRWKIVIFLKESEVSAIFPGLKSIRTTTAYFYLNIKVL